MSGVSGVSGDGVEVLLVRHGQSTANVGRIWQGRIDYELSEAGRDQAHRAGRALAGVKPARIYSSPLSRAAQSARIIASEICYPETEIEYLRELAERSGGMLEGYTWDEFEAEYPDSARRFFELPDDERWEYLGAESTRSALVRMRQALETVRSCHEPGDRAILVSHGGLLGSFFLDEFGPEIPGGENPLANGSITRLILDDNGPRIKELGNASHLG